MSETETIVVELEVDADTLVSSLLEVIEHKMEEVKGSEIKGRIDSDE